MESWKVLAKLLRKQHSLGDMLMNRAQLRKQLRKLHDLLHRFKYTDLRHHRRSNRNPAVRSGYISRLRSRRSSTVPTRSTAALHPIPETEIVPRPISVTSSVVYFNQEENAVPLNYGDCIICHAKLMPGKISVTVCGHMFCEGCLGTWLTNIPRCPTCRRTLRGRKMFFKLY